MSNPLVGNNMSNGSPSNRMNMIIQMLSNGISPEQLLKQNPQLNQAMTQVKNMCGDRSPKDVVMQLAKQQGIDIKQIEDLARKMGAK